jgi:arylsulfatase A-like enzyme
MEAALRTRCIARWPGRIASGRKRNEIVHIADRFTTLLTMAGLPVPDDRLIDGRDQPPFLSGAQEKSNREGFLYWNGEKLYGVKWQNFKLVPVEQEYLTDPALPLGSPHVVNLVTDPKEREPFHPVYCIPGR